MTKIIITKTYQIFVFLKTQKMKKIISILFICLFLLSSSKKEKLNLEITYLGYTINKFQKNSPSLNFDITNLSNDTIFISEKNIIIHVLKNNKEIKSDKNSGGLLYFGKTKPKSHNCKEIINEKRKSDSIKLIFSKKVYNKNFNANNGYKLKDADDTINYISSNCIVLLPKETVKYETFFESNLFDKNCEVSAEYKSNKVFTTFYSGDKLIEVYDLSK